MGPSGNSFQSRISQGGRWGGLAPPRRKGPQRTGLVVSVLLLRPQRRPSLNLTLRWKRENGGIIGICASVDACIFCIVTTIHFRDGREPNLFPKQPSTATVRKRFFCVNYIFTNNN